MLFRAFRQVGFERRKELLESVPGKLCCPKNQWLKHSLEAAGTTWSNICRDVSGTCGVKFVRGALGIISVYSSVEAIVNYLV